jgi:SSS family solute:Na+ symporter
VQAVAEGGLAASAAAIFARTSFGPLDWAIVCVYLLISVGIGIYARSFVRTMDDFVVAKRSVRTALGVASMSSTELGLITVMYSAQKGFVGGFAAFHIAVVAAAVALLVGLTGFLVVRLRAYRVLTIPEFYEKRFGRRTRVLGGTVLALAGILNMGMFLKVESMFIVAVTGMEPGATLTAVMVILMSLALLYTVFGGMVSDMVTDYLQFVVLAFGLLAACWFAVREVGWDHAFQAVAALKGEAGFNPVAAEGAFGPSYVVWMSFLGLVSCAIWPTAVARALAADSEKTVKRIYTWSSIGFLARFLMPYFLGICALVWVTEQPELKAVFFPSRPGAPALDNLYALPVFLSHILPAGIIGIVVAAMLAALMSTYDSYFLTWSSVITQDVVAPLTGNRIGTRARLLLTRLLMVAIGLYLVYWGLFYKGRDDIWDYMAVSGAIYFTGAFAVLLGGLYWKRASSTGATLAILSGCSAVLGLSPVQDLLGVKWPSAWVGLATVAASVVTMVAGSLLFPDRPTVRRTQ